MRICIIDTGSANLNSVNQALVRLNLTPVISSDLAELKQADRLILPGVGTAGNCMAGVQRNGLTDFIKETTTPLLGICLGMQILATDSTEADLSAADDSIQTLDIIKGHVVKLNSDGLRLPHMGWNTVRHTDHPLFDGIKQDAYFYFDHSFALECGDYSIGITNYGSDFTAALVSQNFMGVQFHPEKSGTVGSRLLENFIHNF